MNGPRLITKITKENEMVFVNFVTFVAFVKTPWRVGTS